MFKSKLAKISRLLIKVAPMFALAGTISICFFGEPEVPECLKNE